MRHPIVSVGLPVYNGEKYLKQALYSICNQDFHDFELIISDNASIDGTAEICKTYAANDSRIRYLRNEKNIGAARNYERVFELSRGELFKWCSHDDVCHPSFLRRCVEIFTNAPSSVVLVYPRCELIDEFGKVLGQAIDRVETRARRPNRRLAKVIRHVSYAYPIWGLIRQEYLRQTRLTGSVCYWDDVLLAELSLFGEIWEIPEVLSQQRCHPDNSVAICSSEQGDEVSGDLNKANKKTRRALLEWTDPSRSTKRIWLPVQEERCLEYMKRVYHAPLPCFEKVLCYLTVLTVSYWRRVAKRGGMWKRMLLGSFRQG
jgi:glycosyltransferase involved in cell wall biosynthesis